MEQKVNIKKIKILKKKILNLTKKEHIEVFKIIKENKENYSENRNGVFINMNNLDTQIIEKVSNFVDFCYENNRKMDLDNQIIQNLKENLQKNEIDSEKIKKTDSDIQYIYNEQKEIYNLNNLQKEILKYSLKKEKTVNTKNTITKKDSIII
jgi:hypothetical protein